jgi:hypothetical protein
MGGLIYGMGLYNISDNHKYLVLWITVAICGSLCAVLSMIFFDYAVIVASALIGGYLFIRVSQKFLIIFIFRE